MRRVRPLPRSEPESQGVSSAAILDFLKGADESIDAVHGFMLLRHGSVVAEGAWKPYRLDSRRMLFSLSKSFTSTAIGLAIDEGRLSLDDTLLSFFPREAPNKPSRNLESMRVRHLLTMSTGHEADTIDCLKRSVDPVRAFLSLPVEREPGSYFLYNTGASFMLSAIIQRLTGRRLTDYLKSRLFEPIGIEGAQWDRHPCGVDFGGFGLSLKLEDIARFGQLYLRKGEWEGRRVVPEAWVEEATSKRIENDSPEEPHPESDWRQGYGYQFWRCRHGFYRGDGAFGQFCVVMPELDAVVVLVSGLGDMQALLDLVWSRLLPGISAAPEAAAPNASAELGRFVASLRFRPQSAPPGAAGGPVAGAAAGIGASVSGKVFRFERNATGLETIGLDFGPEALEISYRVSRKDAQGGGFDTTGRRMRSSGKRMLRCGYGEWIEGVSWLDGEGSKSVAASGAWTSADTFTMRILEHEAPFVTTLALKFEEGRLRIDAKRNVGFGPLVAPPYLGR